MTEAWGCAACWSDDAEAALTASRKHKTLARLVDESHFIVSLRSCNLCPQQFVSIFTEMIDWSGGDDAQYRTILPVTTDEAAGLVRAGSKLTGSELNTLGRARRCLHDDHPTAKEARVCWSTGIFIGPHD